MQLLKKHVGCVEKSPTTRTRAKIASDTDEIDVGAGELVELALDVHLVVGIQLSCEAACHVRVGDDKRAARPLVLGRRVSMEPPVDRANRAER